MTEYTIQEKFSWFRASMSVSTKLEITFEDNVT